MPNRLTKIYTRSGDQGFTHFQDGDIPKSSPLIHLVGELDELNAALGMTKAAVQEAHVAAQIEVIQQQLFDMGGELHVPLHPKITQDHIAQLEIEIDVMNAELAPLKEFILPGSSFASATCHLARTICRRLERNMVANQTALANAHLIPFINRLSDWLFVMARTIDKAGHQPEVLWNNQK